MERVFLFTVGLLASVQAIAPPPLINITYVQPSVSYIGQRMSFRHIYVTHDGNSHTYRPSQPSITITATSTVKAEAMRKAAHIVAHMIKYSPNEVFMGLTRSLGVGLFSPAEGPTIFPENSNLADYPECYNRCSGKCSVTCTFDGRKWQSIAGLTNTRACVLAENVMCSPGDPYGHSESILNHEFGHLVHRYVPQMWKNKIGAAYRNAYNRQLWKLGTYAMANAHEYFAEATEAFFLDSKRTDVTGGMNMCGTNRVCPNERSSREYLKRHDPALYETLVYAYTNGRPNMAMGLKICVD
ncbi:uncharacterized protein LOC115211140 [Octopus sinensis]|uniref:Uncharacterized protein LOC115211140 n=1 Tax=Octopus sinensis TaxID=2607531 RepID=A0A6P7SCA7_9MOLL|nr:uncharacterized protein LOC115211140 [Octopus sinensis]